MHVVPMPRHVVGVGIVQTPEEQVRPLQQAPAVQGWPARRHEVVGARHVPVVQVSPVQHGVVAEQVAPVVRQTLG